VASPSIQTSTPAEPETKKALTVEQKTLQQKYERGEITLELYQKDLDAVYLS